MIKHQLIMRESHPLEDCPEYSKLDAPISLEVYGKLDFDILMNLKKNVTLLSTFDCLEPKGNIEESKFKVLLTRKYLEDNDAFYIYGSILYPHDPLNEKELIYPLLYTEDDCRKRDARRNDKNMILVYYAYMLAQNISPVIPARFHTDFSDLKEWYVLLARLHSDFEAKILYVNDAFIIVAHPPCLLEYVSGAYDFKMPNKKKEELLEIEVEKGLEIINMCHEFSKDLFLNYNLLEDLRFISPINTNILNNYLPKRVNNAPHKRYGQNKFKEFLKEDTIGEILSSIFARPLSKINFDNGLNNVLDIIANPDKFERECEENKKAFEKCLEEACKRYKKNESKEISDEEKKMLKKYGIDK